MYNIILMLQPSLSLDVRCLRFLRAIESGLNLFGALLL